MKLYAFYKCGNCGNVAPLSQALAPPTNGEQAKEIPCAKCQAMAWTPVTTPIQVPS
jgi:DNA-directed RNA polymerase subunit RPC12/RpoP